MSRHTIMEKPLAVLTEELGRILQHVQSELEAYINNPMEATGLQTAALKMDQVRSVFLMLEQAAAAALAQEIAALLRGLSQGDIENNSAVQQTLHYIVMQFSTYLAEWQQSMHPPTWDLGSLQRQLRTVQGLPPLPPITATSNNSLSEAGMEDLRKLATQLRPALQHALLGVLRGQQVADNLARLARIFGQLRERAPADSAGRFWGLVEVLVQAMRDSGLPLTQPLHWLLRDVDQQLKYLSETGRLFSSRAAEQSFEQRLIEQLESGGNLPRLQNAADIPNDRKSVGTLAPPETETLEEVFGLLQESLNQVKENIETFIRTKQTYQLQQAIAGSHNISNVLIMLNMDRAAGFLQPTQGILQQWLAAGVIAEEDCIQLAGDLILLESGLHAGKEWACELSNSAVDTAGLAEEERARLKVIERQRTARSALEEAVQAMQRARMIVATALEQGATALGNDLKGLLYSVSGVLVLLEYEQIAGLMRSLEESVGILARQENPQAGLLAAAADVMSAIEYDLEILSAGKKLDEALIQLVEQPLNRLVALLEQSEAAHSANPGNPALQQPILTSSGTAVGVAELVEEHHRVGEDAVEPLGLILSPPLEREREGWSEVEVAVITAEDSAHKPMPVDTSVAMETDAQQPLSPPADSVDPEILDIFFEELQDELATIGENLLLWRKNPADRQALLTLRRSFHTLKGSGRMVQQMAIGNFAGRFEQLLNHLRDGHLAPSPQLVDWVDEARNVLLASSGCRDGAKTPGMAALQARVEALLQGIEEQTEQNNRQPVEELAAGAISLPTPPGVPSLMTVAPPAKVMTSPVLSPGRAGIEVDPKLIEIFQCEANEILDTSDLILQRWKEDPSNNPLLNDLRRAMHTLKGSSRMAGFMVIGDLAHAIESVLDQIPRRSLQDTDVMVDALQHGLDRLSTMLVELQSGNEIQPAGELILELRTLVGEPITGKPSAAVVPKTTTIGPAVIADTLPATLKSAPPALTRLDQETVEAFQLEAAEILDATDVALRRWNQSKDNTDLLH
ncbi:MAG TPA: Hpt domain-containing protein, partial [Candidatus Competibacteraceae bacterium]|nr:Hpt domain-containing protein [Candidatus Competibacteraceae bacterium]